MKAFTKAGPKHSETKRVFNNQISRLPGFRGVLLFALMLALPGSLLALTMATPSLEKRVDSSQKVFVGKLVNRVEADGWVKADLSVEEPLVNARKGELVPVMWRLIYAAGPIIIQSVEGDNGIKKVARTERKPVFDRAEGARGIAILDNKHNGRYWLRADKYEDINKLAKVRELAGQKTGEDAQPAGKSLVEGSNRFAIKMYQQLKETEGNLFFSPYSISSALGMTYAGARNNTAAEMKEALSFPGSVKQLCHSFGDLQDRLNAIQKDGNIKLTIANAIWAEKSYTFLPTFLKLVQQDFKAKLEQADFVKNAKAERLKINAWVEQETHEKIKNLIPKGVLNSLTRMVLVNAIYFKGDWVKQFDNQKTRERDFHISPTEKVKVQMMSRKDTFRLAQDADTQALEMPYKGGQLSMLVLLPRDKKGIDKLEQNLTGEKVETLIGRLRETAVQVSFPKFKMKAAYSLVPPLRKLGMKDAFAAEADFSGMNGTKDLYISEILHKAFVEVDEKGTEAAATTAVVVATRSMPHYEQVKADHPFLFLIRDTATGSILFMGRVADPTA